MLKEKIYKINHPTNDHFFPIFVAVGAANESKGKCLVYDELGFSTSIVFEWINTNKYDYYFYIKEFILKYYKFYIEI